MTRPIDVDVVMDLGPFAVVQVGRLKGVASWLRGGDSSALKNREINWDKPTEALLTLYRWSDVVSAIERRELVTLSDAGGFFLAGFGSRDLATIASALRKRRKMWPVQMPTSITSRKKLEMWVSKERRKKKLDVTIERPLRILNGDEIADLLLSIKDAS